MVDGRWSYRRYVPRSRFRSRSKTHSHSHSRRTTDDGRLTTKRRKGEKNQARENTQAIESRYQPRLPFPSRRTGSPGHRVTVSLGPRPNTLSVQPSSIDIPQYYHIAVKHDWTQHQRMTNRLDRTDAQTPRDPIIQMHRTQFKFTCRPLGVGEGEGGKGAE